MSHLTDKTVSNVYSKTDIIQTCHGCNDVVYRHRSILSAKEHISKDTAHTKESLTAHTKGPRHIKI